APDRREELLAGQHLPRMAHERGEELELRGREPELTGPAPRRPFRRLENDVGESKPVGRPRAPQKGAHAREQLLVGERLNQVVVGAAVEAAYALLRPAERGQHEDRKLRGLAEAPADG